MYMYKKQVYESFTSNVVWYHIIICNIQSHTAMSIDLSAEVSWQTNERAKKIRWEIVTANFCWNGHFSNRKQCWKRRPFQFQFEFEFEFEFEFAVVCFVYGYGWLTMNTLIVSMRSSPIAIKIDTNVNTIVPINIINRPSWPAINNTQMKNTPKDSQLRPSSTFDSGRGSVVTDRLACT